MKTVKRILSWVVLSIGFDIVFFIGWGLTLLTILVFKEIATLSLLVRLLLYVVSGVSLICIAIAPLTYGSSIVVVLSEMVCESDGGIRYSILSSLYSVFSVGYAVWSVIIQNRFPVWSLYLALFCVCLKQISKVYRKKKQEIKEERIREFVNQYVPGTTIFDKDKK